MLTGTLWAVELTIEMVVRNRRAFHVNLIILWLVFFLLLFLLSDIIVLLHKQVSFLEKLKLAFDIIRPKIQPILSLSNF